MEKYKTEMEQQFKKQMELAEQSLRLNGQPPTKRPERDPEFESLQWDWNAANVDEHKASRIQIRTDNVTGKEFCIFGLQFGAFRVV
jgi:hypothetical protein